MAYSNLADALAIPTALLVSQSWIDPSVHLIRVAGYALQGDGGDAYWQDFGLEAPPHKCFLGPSLDGRYWGPGQAELDPRALGAKSDGIIFGDGIVSPGKLNQLSISGYQFSAIDIGKPICVTSHLGLFSGPGTDATTNTTFTTIVNVVAGTGTCILGVGLPAGAIGLSGWFGTDDSVAINNVLTACGFTYANPQTPNAPFNTSFPGQIETVWQIGTIKLRFRNWPSNQVQDGPSGSGRLRPLYVAAHPIFFTSGAQISFDQGVKLIASPAWNSVAFPGQALLTNIPDSNGNPLQCWENVFEDLNLDGMGVVPTVFWFANGQYATFDGEMSVKQPRVTAGCCVKMGPGANVYGGFCTAVRGAASWSLQAQSSNLASYLGNTSTGWSWEASSNDNNIGWSIEIAGFSLGYSDVGFGNNIAGEVHVYTEGAYGYMPTGALWNGAVQAYVERLFIDTPCATVGNAYGATFEQSDVTIGELRAWCNNAFKDNAGTGLLQNAFCFNVEYTVNPKGLRTLIRNLKAQRSDSSVLWVQISDLSQTVSAASCQVNDFASDGNYVSLGYTDWQKIETKQALATVAGALAELAQAKKAIVNAGPQLWMPSELSNSAGSRTAFQGVLNYWLDASMTAWADNVMTPFGTGAAMGNGSSISQWHSRMGLGMALQTFVGKAPTFDNGSWTLGTGFFGASGQVDFNGTTELMVLYGGRNPTYAPWLAGQVPQTSVQIFLLLIPKALAGLGLICRIGGSSWSPEVWQDGANASFFAIGEGQVGVHEVGPYTPGTPVLLTATYTVAASAQMRLNGAQTYSVANGLGNVAGDGGALGAIPGLPATSFASFDLAEMIVTTGLTDSNDFTLTQTRVVEGYLAWKWGEQALLPAGHPFGSGGTNAAPTA